MQFLYTVLLAGILASPITWQTDFEKAKTEAKSEHKLILLNFSGSDWCGPCIRLKKDIFDSETFMKYADENNITSQFPER